MAPQEKKIMEKHPFLRGGPVLCLVISIWILLCGGVFAKEGRWIVALEAEPLTQWAAGRGDVMFQGRLDFQSEALSARLATLEAAQEKVVQRVQSTLPGIRVARFLDEENRIREHRYNLLFHGFTVDLGDLDAEAAVEKILKIPGVRAVYPSRSHGASMHRSLSLIQASSLWEHPQVRERRKAGAGIKIASMDSGIHKDAAMFSPEGFSWPLGFPVGGLGLTANNNGKIIASRAYSRADDPPALGDKDPWPGPDGNSHGVHTAGTAAGNPVIADFFGDKVEISGVAPGAWVMSYKVLYKSQAGKETFDTPEGIAALEDMVRDGADVIICSWGTGPYSTGGAYDPLDTALLNAWRAGVFVSLSMGNDGPNKGTSDHPSEDYMVVASIENGRLISGFLELTAPQVPENQPLRTDMFLADFGPKPSLGARISHAFKAAKTVNPDNATACQPFEDRPFEGQIALVQRGGCNFDVKILNAQNAGALFAVVINTQGEEIYPMGCTDFCEEVEILSVLIGRTAGSYLEEVDAELPQDAKRELLFSFTPQFRDEGLERLAGDSSRGPGVGLTLKPDIAAPGVNIFSQGFDREAQGEAVHLGFGMVSGTSMAAPHVAGAAALLKQIHPLWSNSDIKSALMSTSKFKDIHNQDGSPAQPLDMGAGRMDLAKAVDPGLILSPPSLGFGLMAEGEKKTLHLTVRSVVGESKTYTVSTLNTEEGFDKVNPFSGVTVTPQSFTLAPFGSTTLEVSLDAGRGAGDRQGYVLLRSDTHEAHFPVWGRIAPDPGTRKGVLLVDMDGSAFRADLKNYQDYYIRALEALSLTSDVLEVESGIWEPRIPEAAALAGYGAMLLFSGDNGEPTLTPEDMDRIVEFGNNGGLIIAMGQHMFSRVLNPGSIFYKIFFGQDVVTDSVSAGELPVLPVMGSEDAPPVFSRIWLDFGKDGDGAGNQRFMDGFSSGILRYPGGVGGPGGYVLKTLKKSPDLETPGITNPGRIIFAGFGLEGVNNDRGAVRREELMELLFDWAWDSPRVEILDISEDTPNRMGMSRFEVTYTSDAGADPVSVRWDMGDGSGFKGPYDTPLIGHVYDKCGPYALRVEVLDSLGNRTLASLEREITHCLEKETAVPDEPVSCFIGGLVAPGS